MVSFAAFIIYLLAQVNALMPFSATYQGQPKVLAHAGKSFRLHRWERRQDLLLINPVVAAPHVHA